MRNKKLIIFSAITIIVIVAASITAQLQAPQKIRSKDILFPDLASQINEISLIEIQGNNQLLILHTTRDYLFFISHILSDEQIIFFYLYDKYLWQER